MSTCLGKWVSAFVDGEVSGADQDRMAAHLVRCQNCRRAVALERATKQLVTTGQVVDLTFEVERRRIRRAPVVAGAALAVLAGAAGVIAGSTQPPSGPVVTPPIAAFSAGHYGAAGTLPIGGPALGIVPAAFRSPGP